ncbi:MAG: hypothetical protein LBI71_07320 [Enterobacteriaceae bacterium]|nr:hypothetical protein [Enterobacteriaceae bacterium]
MRYICPPLEADIASPTAMKVYFSLSERHDTRRGNFFPSGNGFSSPHLIFNDRKKSHV